MQLSDLCRHWALVTGASSGIGREFAVQLAAAGMNVALVARRGDLLDALATQLRERHHVETQVIAVDLARPGAPFDVRASLELHNRRIRLLCNNAAFGQWGSFEKTTLPIYQDMIQVNIASLVGMCHCFLPDLAHFSTSVVINVSSAAAYQPVPYMAVYAATKAFVQSFSQALHGEWRARGVLVQTLVPGPTQTAFDTLAGAYPSTLTKRGSPEDVVRVSLRHLKGNDPVALSARGTLSQRIFALCPPKIVIREVAKRFLPP